MSTTKELEEAKIIELVSVWYEGATFIPTLGIWKGEKEKSCIIEVQGDYRDNYIDNFIASACKVLKQEAIGLSINGGELSFKS